MSYLTQSRPPQPPHHPAYEHPLLQQVLRNAGDFSANILNYIGKFHDRDPARAKSTFDRRIVRAAQIQDNLRNEVEAVVADFESDEDDVYADELRCIHWNCGGLSAQFDPKKQMGFATVLAVLRPDVVLLNELKVREADAEKRRVQAMAAACDYLLCEYTPSSHPNNRAMRGSAILSRRSNRQLAKVAGDAVTAGADPDSDVPAFEMVRVVYQFRQARIEFNSFYLSPRSATLQNLNSFLPHFRQNCNAMSIFAGDLNITKSASAEKFAAAGLVDALHPQWATNHAGNTATAIDHVLVARTNLQHIRAHKPARPAGQNVHAILCFDVTPTGFGQTSPCTSQVCTICDGFSFTFGFH